MAALIPIGLSALGAIPSFISGIMGIADNARKLRGGKVRRHRVVHRAIKHKRRGGKIHRKRRVKKHRRGRGVVADTLSNIPLLGALLGPLAKAFGGKLRRMPAHKRRLIIRKLMAGRGLAPMYMQRPYVGMGLTARPHHKMARKPKLHGKGLAPYGSTKRLGGYIPYTFRSGVGRGLAPMYMQRPYVGRGLLAPAGGAVYRKGHLRKIPGRAAKVRVAPTMVHHGGRMAMVIYRQRKARSGRGGTKKKGYRK